MPLYFAYDLLEDPCGISESNYQELIDLLDNHKSLMGLVGYSGNIDYEIEKFKSKVKHFNGRCYIIKDSE